MTVPLFDRVPLRFSGGLYVHPKLIRKTRDKRRNNATQDKSGNLFRGQKKTASCCFESRSATGEGGCRCSVTDATILGSPLQCGALRALRGILFAL